MDPPEAEITRNEPGTSEKAKSAAPKIVVVKQMPHQPRSSVASSLQSSNDNYFVVVKGDNGEQQVQLVEMGDGSQQHPGIRRRPPGKRIPSDEDGLLEEDHTPRPFPTGATVVAQNEDGSFDVMQLVDDSEMSVGAMATAHSGEEVALEGDDVRYTDLNLPEIDRSIYSLPLLPNKTTNSNENGPLDAGGKNRTLDTDQIVDQPIKSSYNLQYHF